MIERLNQLKKNIVVKICALFLLGVPFLSIKATASDTMNVNQLMKQGEQASNHYAQITSDQNKVHTMDGAILFVSLGMPKLVLRQYLRQANRLHIPIVIRGLLQNNLKMTANRVYDLLHPKHQHPIKSGFEIDPVLFRAFHVSVVPALVITAHNDDCEARENCPHNQYSIVYGNVPLTSLLSLIVKRASKPAIRKMATMILSSNRGTTDHD
jgi:conjugal transfer pilus assembly protein TrbC